MPTTDPRYPNLITYSRVEVEAKIADILAKHPALVGYKPDCLDCDSSWCNLDDGLSTTDRDAYDHLSHWRYLLDEEST